MYRNKFSGQDNLSLGTYQVHPAILLVSPVLRVEPTIPYQQANPWILPHLQNLLQKYRKFLVWNEAYEQFDVSLFKKEREKEKMEREWFPVTNRRTPVMSASAVARGLTHWSPWGVSAGQRCRVSPALLNQNQNSQRKCASTGKIVTSYPKAANICKQKRKHPGYGVKTQDK